MDQFVIPRGKWKLAPQGLEIGEKLLKNSKKPATSYSTLDPCLLFSFFVKTYSFLWNLCLKFNLFSFIKKIQLINFFIIFRCLADVETRVEGIIYNEFLLKLFGVTMLLYNSFTRHVICNLFERFYFICNHVFWGQMYPTLLLFIQTPLFRFWACYEMLLGDYSFFILLFLR